MSEAESRLAAVLTRLLDAVGKIRDPGRLPEGVRAELEEAEERAAKVLIQHAAKSGDVSLPPSDAPTFRARWRRLRVRIAARAGCGASQTDAETDQA